VSPRFHQAIWAAIEASALFGAFWALFVVLSLIAPGRMP
jgi:hypothetical protein